ncbi:MAG: formyltransferase family protein, partial [Flavobacteriales bacterium]|nr:formyltransferase family protein [Flavobacteriales bacterium]
MKVVLLVNNSNRGQALAHLIHRAGLNLKLVVVENASLLKTEEKSALSYVKQTLGPSYRLLRSIIKLSSKDRRALRYEGESMRNAEAKVNKYIEGLGVNGRPENIEYLEVPSLNSSIAVNAVVKAEPDLCVVMGTSILRSRMISIPKIGTINAHTSILPEYRGARSEFWQCYNQDYRNVGVTLHFIDKGVDTGNILFQKKQDVGENPDPNMLRANNTFAILENYVPIIEKVLKGEIEPKKQG